MKRHLSSTIAILMLIAAFTAATQAQGPNSPSMRAHIPFAFHVGSKQLPAGEYRVTVLNPSSDQKVLQIRSIDGSVSAIVRTLEANAKATEKSKLVFHRYTNSYYFAQAQVSGELTTFAAIKSSAERNEERTIARNGHKTDVAILVE
jgi:hypothetical protein